MTANDNKQEHLGELSRDFAVFLPAISNFYNTFISKQRVTEGKKINFFGNLASTTTIPAQIIKKYKCDLVPIYIERSHKYFFKMYVSEPIVMNDEKSQDEISIHLNKILEKTKPIVLIK